MENEQAWLCSLKTCTKKLKSSPTTWPLFDRFMGQKNSTEAKDNTAFVLRGETLRGYPGSLSLLPVETRYQAQHGLRLVAPGACATIELHQ